MTLLPLLMALTFNAYRHPASMYTPAFPCISSLPPKAPLCFPLPPSASPCPYLICLFQPFLTFLLFPTSPVSIPPHLPCLFLSPLPLPVSPEMLAAAPIRQQWISQGKTVTVSVCLSLWRHPRWLHCSGPSLVLHEKNTHF